MRKGKVHKQILRNDVLHKGKQRLKKNNKMKNKILSRKKEFRHGSFTHIFSFKNNVSARSVSVLCHIMYT